MNKALIMTIFLSTLISVKSNAENSRQGKTHNFRWATFESYNINRLIENNIEETAKLPGELNFDEKKRQRRINELEISKQALAKFAEEICDKKTLPSKIKKPSNQKEFAIGKNGEIIRDRDWEKYLNFTASKKYRDCINEERQTPEFIKINTMIGNEEDLHQRRSDYISKLKQDSRRILRQYVADYAKENQFDLIILRQPESVIYDKNEGMLDITIPLEAYIQTKLNLSANNHQ